MISSGSIIHAHTLTPFIVVVAFVSWTVKINANRLDTVNKFFGAIPTFVIPSVQNFSLLVIIILTLDLHVCTKKNFQKYELKECGSKEVAWCLIEG